MLVRSMFCVYPEANCEKSIQEGLDSIGFELWNKAATLVEKHHENINGLGGRLASEIRFEGQEFVLVKMSWKSFHQL